MLAAAWLTAIGTLAVALAAVGVAWWTERRAAARLAREHRRQAVQMTGERARHDRELGEERERRDRELADERAHSVRQLEAQQAFSRQQLEAERRLAEDREQLAEAYAVQVVHAERSTDAPIRVVGESSQRAETRILVAVVVNHGRYTINNVGCQFHLRATGSESDIAANKTDWLSGFPRLDDDLRSGLAGPPAYNPYLKTLAPWDIAIRYETDAIATKFSLGWYPIVRWTDRWGTRWERKLGEVRGVNDDTGWIGG